MTAVLRTHADWVKLGEDLEAARELSRRGRVLRGRGRGLARARSTAEERLRQLLIPRDPSDRKDVLLEVKSGEGGEESALFAGDLFRMYSRYAERRGWSTEILDANESDLGGYKSVTVAVKAKGTPKPARRRSPCSSSRAGCTASNGCP